ncbi:MAG: hypothetical protein JNL24_00220 [Bacteroidia bacterium]|nr:hypothetical protein [Bacteroidia bacterium]
MKKNTLYIIAVFTILISSCEKRPFDKRNKYMGRYHFEHSFSTCNGASNPPCSTTYSEGDGEIYYNKNESKSTFHIDMDNGSRFTFEFAANYKDFNGYRASGYFQDKKTVIFSGNASSPGSTGGYSFKGIKTSQSIFQ